MINEGRMAGIKKQKDDDIIDLTEVVVVGAAKNKAVAKSLSPTQNNLSSDDVLDNMVEEFEQSKQSAPKKETESLSNGLDMSQLDDLMSSLNLEDEAEGFNAKESFIELDEVVDAKKPGSKNSFDEDEEIISTPAPISSPSTKKQAASGKKADLLDLSDLDVSLDIQDIDEELNLIAADILDDHPVASKEKATEPEPASEKAPAKAADPELAPEKAPAKAVASERDIAPEKSGTSPARPAKAPNEMSSEINGESGNRMRIENVLDDFSNKTTSSLGVLQESVNKIVAQVLSLESQIHSKPAEEPTVSKEIVENFEKRTSSLEDRVVKLEEGFAEQENLAAQASNIPDVDDSSSLLQDEQLGDQSQDDQLQEELDEIRQDLAEALDRISSLEANMERDVTLATAKILKEEIIPFIISNIAKT